jgi:UDP-N-acetylglucosamine--dolichyl-phosphate N-acetylglucosaminephosphotransferase
MASLELLFIFFVPLLPSIYIVSTCISSSASHSEGSNNAHSQKAFADLIALFPHALAAFFAFLLTKSLIPTISTFNLKAGLFGKDMGKTGMKDFDGVKVPEALGIVSGTVFLIFLIFTSVILHGEDTEKLLDTNSALLSICFMLFLGFADDVIDVPWRYKLILPTVATLPLLVTYSGSTSIVVPIQMRSLLYNENSRAMTAFGDAISYIIDVDTVAKGAIVNLGLLYLVYAGMLAIFTTNAINIYAGINGLEAGQTYIIACAVVLHNVIEVANESASAQYHLFSLMLMLPFLGCTAGLLVHNWYPSKVFVGDTFCYFAGMTFACAGIHGHFSKTLLLFFIPQVANFIYR